MSARRRLRHVVGHAEQRVLIFLHTDAFDLSITKRDGAICACLEIGAGREGRRGRLGVDMGLCLRGRHTQGHAEQTESARAKNTD